MNDKNDTIEVHGLQVPVHIGVPDEEREHPQELLLDLTLEPNQGFDDLNDDIAGTVDYYELTRGLAEFAAKRPRKLIETLAVDCADWLLETYPLQRVHLRVRKFILDDAEHVAVTVQRTPT